MHHFLDFLFGISDPEVRGTCLAMLSQFFQRSSKFSFYFLVICNCHGFNLSYSTAVVCNCKKSYFSFDYETKNRVSILIFSINLLLLGVSYSYL